MERVRVLGLRKWIETQLSPSEIDNAALGNRLRRLQTLTLDSQTIQREYSAPAKAERQQKKPDSGNADVQAQACGCRPVREALRKAGHADSKSEVLARHLQARPLEEVLVDFGSTT